MIDVKRARAETPGCHNVLHFNNAGAALPPQSVTRAMIEHLQLEAEMGGYEAAYQASEKTEHFYEAIAMLLGCGEEEVAFIENATRAWDMAFYAIPFKPGDRILTAMAEYASNYIAFLQVARKTGAKIDVIPNDEYGQVDVEALRGMIDERVKLIAITHVPTNGGLVNPAAAIGKIAREAGILFLLDACQSIGQMPLDVKELGCDILSATGRKFLRGPRGTGLLYVRQQVIEQLEPPFLDMHSAKWVARDEFTIRKDARRFENWEMNYAGKIGLGVAIDYAQSWGLENIRTRVYRLAAELRQRLNDIRGVTVRDQGKEQCGIVTFTVAGKSPGEIQQKLAAQKINMTVSSYNSTLLDLAARQLNDLLRASVHYYNTEEEITRFCEAVTGQVS